MSRKRQPGGEFSCPEYRYNLNALRRVSSLNDSQALSIKSRSAGNELRGGTNASLAEQMPSLAEQMPPWRNKCLPGGTNASLAEQMPPLVEQTDLMRPV
jgi:hypothetical protein